jgi:hypothetical protein
VVNGEVLLERGEHVGSYPGKVIGSRENALATEPAG